MQQLTDIKKYIVQGFENPETASDVLRAAREVLAEEGRWMTGEWFHNEHPEVDPEDPFCNNWAVCAEGAVGLVACGVVRLPNGSWQSNAAAYTRQSSEFFASDPEVPEGTIYCQVVFPPEDSELYNKALGYLLAAGRAITGNYYKVEVHSFNDSDNCLKTRTAVLAWFDVAAGMAAYEESGESLPYNLKDRRSLG